MNNKTAKQEKVKRFPVSDVPIEVSSGSSSSSSTDLSDTNSSDNVVSGLFRQEVMNKLGIKRGSGGGDYGNVLSKKPKQEDIEDGFLPPKFLSSVVREQVRVVPEAVSSSVAEVGSCSSGGGRMVRRCRQFWKSGDYEWGGQGSQTYVGMDRVRVHPKFLHSNATSHKWALGAFAELLDNALDEVNNGATYVHIDMLRDGTDGSKMLLVQDDGGGMTPDKMRQCMSLGYSTKSKISNTIGQYGNGFKTSTMRLGADVIVFSRCRSNEGNRPKQSIGMLSYTFLRSTGKEDIVVPMIDYEKDGQNWKKLMRSSSNWEININNILKWSPYATEEALLQQFSFLEDQGTRIVIYNLWEDDEGRLELDFGADPEDIQIRGANRDEKNIQMASKYPNSRHFLTYRHSLRSYASILYLRLPPGFRINLRGKIVEHHNTVNDLMLTQKITYKPQFVGAGRLNSDMVAVVTIGFVKDAIFHIGVQGFNVYHKNRLIKPFWRVWNAAGSDGRGVIGVLEANFVEPAHDKQGFERTTVLSRLEAKLSAIQKTYWRTHCHRVGYAERRKLKKPVSPDEKYGPYEDNSSKKGNASSNTRNPSEASIECQTPNQNLISNGKVNPRPRQSGQKVSLIDGNERASASDDEKKLIVLKEEHGVLRERFLKLQGPSGLNMLNDFLNERDRRRLLEDQVQEAERKLEECDKEQEAISTMIVEEREKRDKEEENLRNKLEGASKTMDGLLERILQLEGRTVPRCKVEHNLT